MLMMLFQATSKLPQNIMTYAGKADIFHLGQLHGQTGENNAEADPI